MTRPGDRLRRLASGLCSAGTMARLIDPVLADLQNEYAEAIRCKRVWRSRWVRVTGYGAFLKVVAVHGCSRALQFALDSTSDDHRTFRRTLAIAAVVAVTMTLLLQLSIWWTVPHELRRGNGPVLFAYLLPASLPVSVPIGLALGVLWALGGRLVSRQLTVAVLIVAAICSMASFVTNGWLAPATNQAFRIAVSGNPDVRRGDREQTFGELRQQASFDRDLARLYYLRWALSCAPFALALFAMAAARRRRLGRWVLAFLGTALFLAPYVTFREPPWHGLESPWVAAWLPNMLLIAISTLLVRLRATSA